VSRDSYRRIVHVESGRDLVERARWCDGFASKLRGFTFRRALAPGEGLVLVEESDGRVSSGITMLFVFMDLGVVWVNGDGLVVDTVVARPWRPSYLPQNPARYVIEAAPDIVQKLRAGDSVQFHTRSP
jgi:uncharacterized membrane protein (UPF0127 family)